MAVAARRSRPAVTRIEKTDKRDALLRAAIETFAARGFFNAQVADVARTAGVAAGTVYLYFRGKDDLLISIFEKTMKEAIASGRESIAKHTDPLAQLRTIARLHLDRMNYTFPNTEASTKPKFFVQGEADDVCPIEGMWAFYGKLEEPKELVVIDGADHLFEGKTQEIGEALEELLADFEGKP